VNLDNIDSTDSAVDSLKRCFPTSTWRTIQVEGGAIYRYLYQLP